MLTETHTLRDTHIHTERGAHTEIHRLRDTYTDMKREIHPETHTH